jgi:protocatechuate 3,4-dioxygenase beta subunit
MSSKKTGRREAMTIMGAAGAAVAFGCGDSPTSPTTSSTPASTTSTNTACSVTPTETVGPYPSLTDLFRSDIRESKQGTVLTLTIKVVNTNAGCAAVPNANVEIWHVDAAGNYSQYGTQTSQTYLRGIQTTNGNGEVTFTTIYPGWYQGRATHIHGEVYSSRGTNPMSNAADGIFADSLSSELVTPTGSPDSGYAATFQIAIAL